MVTNNLLVWLESSSSFSTFFADLLFVTTVGASLATVLYLRVSKSLKNQDFKDSYIRLRERYKLQLLGNERHPFHSLMDDFSTSHITIDQNLGFSLVTAPSKVRTRTESDITPPPPIRSQHIPTSKKSKVETDSASAKAPISNVDPLAVLAEAPISETDLNTDVKKILKRRRSFLHTKVAEMAEIFGPSRTTKAKAGIRFDDNITIHEVERHCDYSTDEHEACWPTEQESMKLLLKNAIEYESEKKNGGYILEEKDMDRCKVSGQDLHPAFVEFMEKKGVRKEQIAELL